RVRKAAQERRPNVRIVRLDDAGERRLRDEGKDARASSLHGATDHRAHRQGDEGGPREMHRSWSIGLHRQAGGQLSPGWHAAFLAEPLNGAGSDRALTSSMARVAG